MDRYRFDTSEKKKFCFKCFEKQLHKFHHKKVEWKVYDDQSVEKVLVKWYKCTACGELLIESNYV